uniref:GST N-terminal domain-containing protein n=1 Tax=Phenylobacterium glaciei TaxID=2803784 RepID=A0A974S9R6_9CAUL|nr:hypothetical protein JKL49_08580 [Phenylobacterium glaciei]
MKLYDSIGPNPHVVRIFIAEKGMTIPTQKVDLMAGENRKPPITRASIPPARSRPGAG